ncbi:hypothetical protein NDN08_007314 [Rhodosorus marinus]|uniref:RING-type domain-containing protein n=1 Tax=Rhodosorus marinus TaxID=101924 RepID=A0AAV8UIW7_9RHOD|nr:hypothetical protein NDN08_007314 [Rhodosorus marinus]
MDVGTGEIEIVAEDGPRFGLVGGSRTRRRRGVVAVDSGPKEVVSILSDDESVDTRPGQAPRKRLRSQTSSDTLAGQENGDSSEIQVVVSTPEQRGASNNQTPPCRTVSTVPGSVNSQSDTAEMSLGPNPEAPPAGSDEVETVNIIRRRGAGDVAAVSASDAQHSGERFRVIDGRLVRIGRENGSLQTPHETTNGDHHHAHLNSVLGWSTDDDDEYMPGVDPFADAALAHQMLDLSESELDALGGTDFPDGFPTAYARGTAQALRARHGGGDRGAPVSVSSRRPPVRASGTRRRVEDSMRRLNAQQNPGLPRLLWQRDSALQGGGGYAAMWLGELARWAMQEDANDTTDPDYEANLRLDDSVPVRRGATQEQIRAIESTTVQESDLKDLCSICISPFTKRGKLKRLPCGHGFHIRCISKWLKINSNCPNCKRRLDGSPSDS